MGCIWSCKKWSSSHDEKSVTFDLQTRITKEKHILKYHRELIKILDNDSVPIVNDQTDNEEILSLIDIFFDHKCEYWVRNLDDCSKTQKIANKSSISHFLDINVVKEYCKCIASIREGNVPAPICKKLTVTIKLCGKINKSPFKNYVARHINMIPIEDIINKLYNIYIPSEIAAEIGSFLDGHGDYGLCYQSSHDCEAPSIHYDHEYGTTVHYDHRVDSMNGDIIWKMIRDIQDHQRKALDMYYGQVINSYNEAIMDYLENKTFYFVTVLRKEIVQTPSVKHILVARDTSYRHSAWCFKAKFGGFNNMNMNEAANDKNTVITSVTFGVDSFSSKCCDMDVTLSLSRDDKFGVCLNKFKKFIENKIGSYEKALNFGKIEKDKYSHRILLQM